MSPKYELYYFDGRGRAEMLRLTFAAAGVQFTDKRIKFENWPAHKPETPQGALPYLVIDGEAKIPESLAILRFLAREFGLYGKSNVEKTWVDVLVENMSGVFSKGADIFVEKDENKKKELQEAFYGKHVPEYFGKLEKAACGQGGYLVGSSLTIADIYMYSLVEGFKLDEALEKFPKLKASVTKVAENEKVKDYLKARPVTQM